MKGFIKKYFISGILVLVPAVVTIWVLKTVILWMDGLIFSFIPHQLVPAYFEDIPGLGLALTIAIILLAGIFTRLYIGRKFVQMGDAIFARVPLGRAIYQATKSVLHSTISENGQKSRRVVLVEFPKAGSYAIGFPTGKWDRTETNEMGSDTLVFIPTAPNPTTGFLLIVPEDTLIPTDMSTEEASKLLISGGFLAKKAELT